MVPHPFKKTDDTGSGGGFTFPGFNVTNNGFAYQQSNGTSSQASTPLFGSPYPVVLGTGCQQSPFGCNVFGQVSGTPSGFGRKPDFVQGSGMFATGQSGIPYTSCHVSGQSMPSFSMSNLSQAPSWASSGPVGTTSFGSVSSATLFGSKPDFGQVSGTPNTFGQVSGTSNPSPTPFGTSPSNLFWSPPFGSTSNSSHTPSPSTSIPSQTPSHCFNISVPCTDTSGFGKAFVDTQQVGSRVSPYVPTTETETKYDSCAAKLLSISAMNVYSNKSHEELRLEDYQQQQKNQVSSSVTSPFVNVSSSVTSPFVNGTSSPAVLSPPKPTVTVRHSFPAVPTCCTTHAVSGPSVCEKSHSDAPKAKEADDSSCVPKGLEIIVENLGFNPWSQGKDNANKLDSLVVGGILSCVEAQKDEDIIALAEFAVEQHNALHKDEGPITFMKVVVACLEPFQGGRYHIVLDTMLPGSVPLKRHYAVVLRKFTPRANNVTVLEKWLSS